MTDSLPKFMVGSGCSLLDQGLELLEGPEGMGLAANPPEGANLAPNSLSLQAIEITDASRGFLSHLVACLWQRTSSPHSHYIGKRGERMPLKISEPGLMTTTALP
ncbi:hypothetical protein XMV201_001798 [Aliiroseovarius sp. xm-v-201]|uniref:hypothetical protein n=1 Tax=unclassified Aliiroseovarius TaxID=2623558 RepID=UPI00156A3580|nr:MULTISPECIES: hypothetical protein [unclassified Aliiroseovarius]NRP50037.1 hypothetical protein [Aliiroseovarius sp. xm-m-354]NRQ04791.1 hypothetical protein [Aliiroseovarius sp. xm-m-309]NRQ07995.1 hypothetical protein [Aliiroseovarius sp. xm-v-201]